MSKAPDHPGSKQTQPRGASLGTLSARWAGLPPAERIEKIQADQRARWQRGERIYVESYLAHLSAANADADAILDLIYGEVLLREAAGDRPQLAEYQRRFPQHAETLARQFAVHEALEGDGLATLPIPCPRVPAESPVPTAVPVIPGYEILGELGRGGLGVVYKARQIALNRLVALKMIRATGGSAHVARFRIEAEASARLQHPNIVQIYEVGEARGRPYLALEFVDGPTLAQHLKTAPPSPRDAAHLIEVLARAIHHAHQQGIVHRDLKPANILMQRAELTITLRAPKIADFGLAKRLDSLTGQTHAGQIIGTPAYMAPEQVQGQPGAVGPWTDVHALGTILYEMLTSRPPFRAATPMDTLLQVARAEAVPPSLLQAKVPRDLEVICLKCLHKQPSHRYADALELADDLRRFVNGEPVRARPAGQMERLVKWARRRPALAALLAAVIVSTTAGIVAVAWESHLLDKAMRRIGRVERDVEAERDEIDQAHLAAEQWRQKAEQAKAAENNARSEIDIARSDTDAVRQQVAAARIEARHERYFSQLTRAEIARQSDDPARAQLLLEECPAESRGWEWHYLKRFCHVRHFALEPPGSPITAAAWRPDGKQLATLDPQGVRLFDAAGKFQTALDGHGCLAFSPRSRFLATGSSGSLVLLWDALAAAQKPLHALRGLTAPATTLAFSPDGKYLAAASGDRAIHVWTRATLGQPPTLFAGHTARVNALAFSTDNKLLVSAGDDRTVRTRDLATGRVVVYRQPGKITALAFVAPRMLAVATHDGTIRAEDASTGKVLFTLEGNAGPITALTGKNGRLASLGEDGLVKVWDMAEGQELLRLPGDGGVAFSPEGGRLLAGQRRGGAAVWNAVSPPVAIPCEGHVDRVHALAFRPDGKLLATASRDKSIRLWDAKTGKETRPPLTRQHTIFAVAFSPDGHQLVTAGGSDADGELLIRDMQEDSEQPLLGHTGKVRAVAFRRDGEQLASAGADGTVRLWDARTGRQLRTLTDHAGAVFAVAFSPNGKQLASAGADRKVKIHDANSGKVLHNLDLPGDRAAAVAFSPDGKQIAAANRAGLIQIWDATGKPLATLTGHPSAVNGIAFHPDGSRLASAGQDGTVRIWETVGGKDLLTLFGHRGPVAAVAFSPDGTVLATGGRDHTVRLWPAPR